MGICVGFSCLMSGVHAVDKFKFPNADSEVGLHFIQFHSDAISFRFI